MLLSGSKYPLGAGGPVAEVTQPNTSNSCQQLSLWRPPHSHCLPGCHPQHQAQDPLLGAPTLTPLFLGVGTAHAKGLPWWLSGKESTCQCRRSRFDPWVGKIPGEGNWTPLQRIPWTEEPGGRQSMGSQSGHDLVTKQQHTLWPFSVFSTNHLIPSHNGLMRCWCY